MKKLVKFACAALLLSTPLANAGEKIADIEEGFNFVSAFSLAGSDEKEAFVMKAGEDEESSRVLNGQKADKGEYPYQVALLRINIERNTVAQFCGGSMVQNDWVLTAAHCVVDVKDDGIYLVDTTDMAIMAGSNDITRGEDYVGVSKIVVHPNYNPNGFDSDVALIKLKRKPKTSFELIQIPTQEYADILEQPGVEAIVTGWGRTETGKSSIELMEGKIQILDRQLCNAVLLEPRRKAAAISYAKAVKTLRLDGEVAIELWQQMNAAVADPINENMICSGTPLGPRGACDGDSGGPLVVRRENGAFIQAGIVSWGMFSSTEPGCDRNSKLSAYTRTGNFTDWVIKVLGEN